MDHPSELGSLVDWLSFLDPQSRVHVVHGGSLDRGAVFGCASHLQNEWGAALLFPQTRAHLSDVLLRGPELTRAAPRVVVAVSTAVVVEWPSGYNELCTLRVATPMVIVAADLVAGPPYTAEADIVVLFLPSARMTHDDLRAAETVYCFPGIAGELCAALHGLRHGQGVCWRVGQSLAASLVEFAKPLVSSLAQDAVSRMFWWVDAFAFEPRAQAIPDGPFLLECAKGSPIPSSAARRVTPTDIVVDLPDGLPRFRAARLSEEPGDLCCHLMDSSGVVTPVLITVAECKEEANGRPAIRCSVKFVVKAAIAGPAPRRITRPQPPLPEL